jgi:peptidyl-tRNA hydrolase
VVVRSDLTPAQQLVQSCHAAYEAGLRTQSNGEPDYSVVLSVDTEADLVTLYESLRSQDLPAVLFREADLGSQATALAAAPITGPQRKAFSRLPLWKP